jgi:hypothetical protein
MRKRKAEVTENESRNKMRKTEDSCTSTITSGMSMVRIF